MTGTSVPYCSVRRQGRTRGGVSLAEVAVSTLLIGILMVAALRTVESSLMTWQAAAGSGDGNGLARQLLDEIMVHTYAEDVTQGANFGPESGEDTGDRSLFDDLDDFDNWSALPPQDAAGNPMNEYLGWSRSVNVQKLNDNSHGTLSEVVPDQGLRQITVTVTSPSSQVTTLVAWRSDLGGTQQTLGVDQTIVTWVGCDLQLDPADDVLSAGTLVSNHAEDQ